MLKKGLTIPAKCDIIKTIQEEVDKNGTLCRNA